MADQDIRDTVHAAEIPADPQRAPRDQRDYVFCPFAGDGVCTGGCPTNRDRACVNGKDD